MADIPALPRQYFERLVVQKLAPSKDLKQALTALMKRIRAGKVPSDDGDKLLLIAESVEALLKAMNRNTSPFYVRQTHALVTLFLGVDEPGSFAAGLDLDVLEALTNRTAITVHKQWLQVGSSGVKPAQ